MGLNENVQEFIHGFDEPSAIQKLAIKPVIEGKR